MAPESISHDFISLMLGKSSITELQPFCKSFILRQGLVKIAQVGLKLVILLPQPPCAAMPAFFAILYDRITWFDLFSASNLKAAISPRIPASF
jgi:hypothetical protein